jgi:hypothetical protein
MLILPGPSALSAFRIQRLLSQLKEINPAVQGIAGRYCHFIDSKSALSDADRQKMEGYLAWKWNLQAKLPADHPYKQAAPVILANMAPVANAQSVTAQPGMLTPITLTGSEPMDYVMALCESSTRTYRDGMQVETTAVTYGQTVSGIRSRTSRVTTP